MEQTLREIVGAARSWRVEQEIGGQRRQHSVVMGTGQKNPYRRLVTAIEDIHRIQKKYHEIASKQQYPKREHILVFPIVTRKNQIHGIPLYRLVIRLSPWSWKGRDVVTVRLQGNGEVPLSTKTMATTSTVDEQFRRALERETPLSLRHILLKTVQESAAALGFIKTLEKEHVYVARNVYFTAPRDRAHDFGTVLTEFDAIVLDPKDRMWLMEAKSASNVHEKIRWEHIITRKLMTQAGPVDAIEETLFESPIEPRFALAVTGPKSKAKTIRKWTIPLVAESHVFGRAPVCYIWPERDETGYFLGVKSLR